MLKRWVVSPLTSADQIRERQEAVQDLVKYEKLRSKISDKLKVLPDLERLMARIFTYSVKSKVKAFYVDMQAVNRLDEFKQLLECFEELQSTMNTLFDNFPIKSTRLL